MRPPINKSALLVHPGGPDNALARLNNLARLSTQLAALQGQTFEILIQTGTGVAERHKEMAVVLVQAAGSRKTFSGISKTLESALGEVIDEVVDHIQKVEVRLEKLRAKEKSAARARNRRRAGRSRASGKRSLAIRKR